MLAFPFKDTVLKAGMTNEDQKEADEPFLLYIRMDYVLFITVIDKMMLEEIY